MWLLIKKMCIIASFITNFQLPDVFRRGAICPPHRRSVGLEPIGDRVNGTQCNLGTSSFTMSTSMLKSVEKLMILSLRLKLTVSYKKSIHAPYADSQVILTLFSHLILFSNNDLMSLARINSKKRWKPFNFKKCQLCRLQLGLGQRNWFIVWNVISSLPFSLGALVKVKG